ncbi:MAG: helix-turn-helix domain-containing protein [Xanthobacteraceae bacterium]
MEGEKRAFSIAEFCRRYGVGRTKAYEELRQGRLRARKIGRRTIVTKDDADDWLQQLPLIKTPTDVRGEIAS